MISDSELQNVQREFNIKFPQHYVNFLRNFPSILITTPEDPWGKLMLVDRIIPNSLEWLARMNRSIRDSQVNSVWIRLDDTPQPWPPSYWAIGDAMGDYYAINTNSSAQTVFLSKHDELSFEPWAENLNEFVSRLVDETMTDIIELRADAEILLGPVDWEAEVRKNRALDSN